MTMNRKIEALQEAAAHKAQEAHLRVEKALERMIKQNQKINFQSVAHSANVSTAYLYKYEEIKNRIITLRDQQKNQSKPKQIPVASDNSKSVMINALREETKRLRTEMSELRRANEALTGRLHQVQGSNDLTERLKKENESLKIRIQELIEQLKAYEGMSSGSIAQSNVTPIGQGAKSSVSDAIKAELEQLDIPLNSTLTKRIKATTEERVLAAITALKDQLPRGEITNPGGWLATAIQDGWSKSEPITAPLQPQREIFTVSVESQPTTKLVSLDKLKTLNNIFQNDD
jgi:DNA repair exonuclease SbcCD ATPase subunit